MPSAVLVARFCRFYPGEYRSTAYRTRDGVIPVGRFWALYRAMPSVQSLERIQHVREITMGIGMALAKSDAGLPSSLRSDLHDAYLDAGDG